MFFLQHEQKSEHKMIQHNYNVSEGTNEIENM